MTEGYNEHLYILYIDLMIVNILPHMLSLSSSLSLPTRGQAHPYIACYHTPFFASLFASYRCYNTLPLNTKVCVS